MNTVVLARYYESIDWIVDIPHEFEVFVYNKGDKLTPSEATRRADHIIERPNTGREAETYLNHMLTNVARETSPCTPRATRSCIVPTA